MNNRSTATLLSGIFLAWLAAYTAAYFVTPMKTPVEKNGINSFTVRYYAADWQVVAFQPAAVIEPSSGGTRCNLRMSFARNRRAMPSLHPVGLTTWMNAWLISAWP